MKAIGPTLAGRDVTFIWSTEEEVGLKAQRRTRATVRAVHRLPVFVVLRVDDSWEQSRFATGDEARSETLIMNSATGSGCGSDGLYPGKIARVLIVSE